MFRTYNLSVNCRVILDLLLFVVKDTRQNKNEVAERSVEQAGSEHTSEHRVGQSEMTHRKLQLSCVQGCRTVD